MRFYINQEFAEEDEAEDYLSRQYAQYYEECMLRDEEIAEAPLFFWRETCKKG